MAELVSLLEQIVGQQNVVTEEDELVSYSTDWTGRFRGRTDLVVRPRDAGEISGVLAVLGAHRVALTIQGGNTGLVGGSVPMNGECVLSLKRLDAVTDVDELAGQLTAGAGATIEVVQQRAEQAGWAYGVDLGSRGTATVGGTVATNAGGLRMIRYGNTRAQLLGIEAVLGDGTIVSHLDGLPKDNTGYDLAALLCGSEGTLGVISAARLRLVAPASERVCAVLAFADVAAAIRASSTLRRRVSSVESLEMFLGEGLALVCSKFGIEKPFTTDHDAYLLVESADEVDPTDRLCEAIAATDGVVDAAFASEPSRRASLWRYREGHTEAINSLGAPHKLDVSLPIRNLAAFVDEVRQVVGAAAPAASTWLFGHVGDGNVHVNVTGVDPDDETVDDAVFRLAVRMGGNISAEHGIGVAKRRWLTLNRSQAEIATYRSIKRALDPAGILSPNVML